MSWIVFDTETNGVLPYSGHNAFAFSTCQEDGSTDVFRFDLGGLKTGRSDRELQQIFRETQTIVMHDAKFDLTFANKRLKHLGNSVDLSQRNITAFEDTSLMARLLRNDMRSFKLKDLAWVLSGYPTDDERAVRKSALHYGNDYSKVPLPLMEVYQRGDAERTWLLYSLLSQKMGQVNSEIRDLYQWEKRLVKTTMRMERRGLRISRRQAGKLIDWLADQSQIALEEVCHHAGRYVNPRGPEIRKVLYDELDLPKLKRTIKGNAWSTGKDSLNQLRGKHPIVDAILKFRSYSRGRTVVQSYLDLADSDSILHPTINTCEATTGRESCSNPNLQNVEKSTSLRNAFPIPARKIFISKPGYITFYFDYAGIELRVLVHYSGDPIITEAFINGEDPHLLPARDIWYAEYWDGASIGQRLIWREASKNVTYAIHYGANFRKAAAVLLLPEDEVRYKWPKYHAMFPGARILMKKVREQVLSQGYVVTEFGRKLYVPRNKPYMGVNYLSQGTATDIMKIGQVRSDDYLMQMRGYDIAGLALPVHDEEIGDYSRSHLKHFRGDMADVAKLLTDFPQMRIPMKVELSISTLGWERKVPYNLS